MINRIRIKDRHQNVADPLHCSLDVYNINKAVQPLCELPQCWMMSGNKSRGPISRKPTHETTTSQSCLTEQRYKGERNYENITTKEREIMRILQQRREKLWEYYYGGERNYVNNTRRWEKLWEYYNKGERNNENITKKEREITRIYKEGERNYSTVPLRRREKLWEYYYKGEENYENITTKQCCGSGYGSISGLDPHSMTHKHRKKFINFTFKSVGYSL